MDINFSVDLMQRVGKDLKSSVKLKVGVKSLCLFQKGTGRDTCLQKKMGVVTFVVSLSGRELVSAGRDKKIRVWDLDLNDRLPLIFV